MLHYCVTGLFGDSSLLSRNGKSNGEISSRGTLKVSERAQVLHSAEKVGESEGELVAPAWWQCVKCSISNTRFKEEEDNTLLLPTPFSKDLLPLA